MTIGDYVLIPESRTELEGPEGILVKQAEERARLRQRGIDSSIYGPDLLGHEAAHSDQWAQYPIPPTFLIAYWAGTYYSYVTTGTDGRGNPFEVGANPYKGRYWKVPDSGNPRPPKMPGIKFDPCYIGLWCSFR
jgi:hypothetical protein